MRRRTVVMISTATLAAALSLGAAPGYAGAPPGVTWTNAPVQGPSPNAAHQVSGNGCDLHARVEPQGLGARISAGLSTPVHVRLYRPDGVTLVREESYSTTGLGEWSGVFEIPAGLQPGVYPLRASCDLVEIDFEYPDRSYTVVKKVRKADRAEAVEAEVSFTG